MVLDRSAAYQLAALVVGLTLAVQQLGGVDADLQTRWTGHVPGALSERA